jgi:hypothetical protein
MYMPDIVARDIRDVDLASSGGITHTWFSGPVLFPFGFGLSYTQFSYTMKFVADDSQSWEVVQDGNGILANRLEAERTLRVRVFNSGGSWRSDCVVLVFIERDDPAPQNHSAQVPLVPREALIAFQRFRGIAPGDSIRHDFHLHFNAVFSAFRDERGSIRPPPGTYALRIGHSLGESDARLSVVVHQPLGL